MGVRTGDGGEEWRRLVAIGLVAGDLSPTGVARYAGVHVSDADAALGQAVAAGVIGADGAVDQLTRLQLVGDLPEDTVAEVHAAVARRLFALGPQHILAAVDHARSAGSHVAVDEMVSMADHGATASLSVGDYESARRLFELAVELDASADFAGQGHRLCALAAALDGLGDVATARQHLARAVGLAELAGDPSLAARAAVQHALPADWYCGDPRTAGLLQRASTMQVSEEDAVRILAGRAFTENRIPLVDDVGQQLAWVTRTPVAQTFGNEAFDRSAGCSDETRLLALLAWRTTHRAPTFLARRREVSKEALDLAQRTRNVSLQVEAAVALAVDALESADRPLADEAFAVARWVAQRDGNPRLRWRADTLAAGLAHLDGDTEEAERMRVEARRSGESVAAPGWMGAEFLLTGEAVLARNDPDEMRNYLFDDSFVGMANPIGRACFALLFARCGDPATAERHVRRAIRQLDSEASFLLLATRLAEAAAHTSADDLCRDLVEVLTPWADHVSVDSHGWWCDGPVAGWLAVLHHRLGDQRSAATHLEAAMLVARACNDVRASRRFRGLQAQLSVGPAAPDPATFGLTERELQVLRLLATGATNPEIARSLAYSVSTIRTDTGLIYRKLDVKVRAEAVSKAIALGLIVP